MNHLDMLAPGVLPEARSRRQVAGDEAAGLLLGAGLTLVLFLGMARFEHLGAAKPAAVIEDLRLVSLPLETPPPPPKPEEVVEQRDVDLLLTGLEAEASDSPVRVAAVPPDLTTLIPATANLPQVRIPLGGLHADLKPKGEMTEDVQHIYQEAEVDQGPRALVRVKPPVPREVRGEAASLRVDLLLLIGRDGRLENVRVVESSGNPRFDAIVAQTVQNEWLFSPAMRRGKKVRVLAQQAFRINFTSGGSPFDVH